MQVPYCAAETDLLYSIASLRSEWLDSFFLFLRYFDSEYFVMVLIPFIWVGISSRWGLRIALLLILSSVVNYHLKHLFDMPRPIVDWPDLAMLPLRDPGFPSGGAQTATLLAGLLIYAWKNVWAWIIAIPYALLISFSRLYLGVHYPIDVLGGIAIGLAILLAFVYSIKHIEKLARREGPACCVVCAAVLSFLYAFLLPSSWGYRFVGAFLGFSIGAYASIRFRRHSLRRRTIWNRMFSGTVAVFTVFVLYYVTPSYVPPLIQAFLLALWISFAVSP